MNTIIERAKGTVRFALRESKPELSNNKQKMSPIILNFAYGKVRLRYSVGYKSCYNDWDFEKQKVRNKSTIENKDEINALLSNLESGLIKEYARLSKTHPIVPKELLVHRLDVVSKRIPESSIDIDRNLTFFDVIEKVIKLKAPNITKITERSYTQTKKRLQEFEKHQNIKLTFDSINMDFYSKFNVFMESNSYSLNTIGKHIKNFKTFLNYALAEGYTTNQRFRSKDFKVKTEVTTEIYLTDSEIEAMLKKDLSKYPELEHARDVFLMGCYSGQRISDYNGLKKEDIVKVNGIRFFKIKQKKNRKYGREVLCPITKEMVQIMKRYDGNPPPKIYEQDLNENIKQVGQMLEWDENVKCEYTKGGKIETDFTPKYDLIKSHTARRSFCTNKYKAGMSVFDIMLFSGHTTEKEFYKYIRIKNQERASHIVKSGFFNV